MVSIVSQKSRILGPHTLCECSSARTITAVNVDIRAKEARTLTVHRLPVHIVAFMILWRVGSVVEGSPLCCSYVVVLFKVMRCDGDLKGLAEYGERGKAMGERRTEPSQNRYRAQTLGAANVCVTVSKVQPRPVFIILVEQKWYYKVGKSRKAKQTEKAKNVGKKKKRRSC